MTAMPRVFPTVLHMLAASGEAAPDRVALRCGDETLSYRQYVSSVAGIATELGAARIVPIITERTVIQPTSCRFGFDIAKILGDPPGVGRIRASVRWIEAPAIEDDLGRLDIVD